MSLALATRRLGKQEALKLYRRFHSLKYKATKNGIPFKFANFETFWNCFNQKLEDDNIESFRLKFEPGPMGYCCETLEVRRKYVQKGGRINPQARTDFNNLPAPKTGRAFPSERDQIVAAACNIAFSLIDSDGEIDMDELVSSSFMAALR